jgi:hypothetical protein
LHRRWITQSQLVLGICIVALAIAAGVISERYVDRRFAFAAAADTETDPSAPCVNADGSWRNWSSPNVPMLSPKCEDGK